MMEKWMEELNLLVREDAWYQRWLADAKRLEPEFLKILHSLPPQQQETLQSYIAACEAMESAQIPLAYALGRTCRGDH